MPLATTAQPFAVAPARAGPLVASQGRVLPAEGTPLRVELTPGFPPIATLPQGTAVKIEQAFPLYGKRWLQVLTPLGAGFVAAETVQLE